MNDLGHASVPAVLDLLSSLEGVRGVLVATPDGAHFGGMRSGLSASAAHDIAKTVRRMSAAAAAMNAELEELSINFGPVRMLVVPLSDQAATVFLLERDHPVAVLRRVIEPHLERLAAIVRRTSWPSTRSNAAANESDDEIVRIARGPLGPVIHEVEGCFARYLEKLGRSRSEADELVRVQMRDWLLCCNPSPYTFPLLIDGLAQLLGDDPDYRVAFVAEVQQVMRSSDLWTGTTQ